MRVVEPTKICPRCEIRKPWSAYYVRTRWEDGSVRTVMAYCKPCNTAHRNHHFAQHPGSKAAACRRYRAKLAKDPARLANYRESQAFYNRAWRERQGGTAGKHTSIPPSASLDTAPFAEWLREVVERDGSTIRATALRLGIGEKTVRNILTTQRHVGLDLVERALIADDTITLRELYPDLYEAA